jgi:hypothetical protein
MAEPTLDRPGVVALVGQRVSAGVAKHMRMCLELQAGTGGRAFDHAGEAGRGGRGRALALEPTQRPKIVALDRVVLGVPFLTRRTCRTAPAKSIWSHRRSQASAARSPCR